MARHARRPRPPGAALAAAVSGVASLAVGLTGSAADDVRLLLLAVVLGQLAIAFAVWAAAVAVADAVRSGATARHLARPVDGLLPGSAGTAGSAPGDAVLGVPAAAAEPDGSLPVVRVPATRSKRAAGPRPGPAASPAAVQTGAVQTGAVETQGAAEAQGGVQPEAGLPAPAGPAVEVPAAAARRPVRRTAAPGGRRERGRGATAPVTPAPVASGPAAPVRRRGAAAGAGRGRAPSDVQTDPAARAARDATPAGATAPVGPTRRSQQDAPVPRTAAPARSAAAPPAAGPAAPLPATAEPAPTAPPTPAPERKPAAPRRAAVPALDLLGLAPARGPAYDVLVPDAPPPTLVAVGSEERPGASRSTGARPTGSRRTGSRRARSAGSGDVVGLRDVSGV